MNTLSKQYTVNFFASESDYLALRKHWSVLVNSDRKHELQAVHHLLYLVMTGKDWRKAFTPPSSTNKLNNGYIPAVYGAIAQLNSNYGAAKVLAPFDGLVTIEMLQQARKLISHTAQTYPLYNSDGSYRCDAYSSESRKESAA